MDDYYEFNNSLDELNQSFTSDNIASFLSELGLIDIGEDGVNVPFKRLVYIIGDTKEIYLEQERNFISLINNVVLFPDVKRKTSKSFISCRCVAAEIPRTSDPVSSAVLFMKIVNKALKGFTCYLFHIGEELYLGCRVYNINENKDCTLIKCNDYERLADQLLWRDEDFLSYYSCVSSALTPRYEGPDFEEERRIRQGRQFAYLDALEALEKYSGESLDRERSRYLASFSDYDKDSIFEQLSDALEDYKFIRSTDINTLELLFEAEEIEKLNMNEDEAIDEQTNSSDYESNEHVLLMEKYKDDPEGLIKELSKKYS